MSSSKQLSGEVVRSIQKLLLNWDSPDDDDNEQGDSPLRRERNREERVYRLVESLGAPKITRVRFFLDRDKDFNVVVEGGLDKEKRFVICIMLNNHTRITCNESQAMQAALKATERGTGLTEPGFRKWATHFEKMSQKVVVGENTRGDVIMNVKPKPMEQNQQYETLPGVIQQTSFAINNNNNSSSKSDEMSVSVDFRTDIEKYSITVSLAMEQRSYADLQCQATLDVLSIAEQGDRMDTLIFLQHCAQLQQKYNLVTVAEQEGPVKVARVCPSKLSATEASVTLTSEFPLPPATVGAVLEGEQEWAKKQLVGHVMKALEDTTDEADDIVRKGLDGKGTDGNAQDKDFEDGLGSGGESLDNDEDRDTDTDLGTAMEQDHLGEGGVEPMDEGTASLMSLSNSLPQ